MQPTASRSSGTDRTIDQLAVALASTGLAKPGGIIGCSASEVEQVRDHAEFPLPDDYLHFLEAMGKASGDLFRGSNILYPILLEADEVAHDIANDPRQTLTIERRFFFGEHKGYKVYFFQKDDPAVYGYQEGHPELPAMKLADNFTDWAWNIFEVLREMDR